MSEEVLYSTIRNLPPEDPEIEEEDNDTDAAERLVSSLIDEDLSSFEDGDEDTDELDESYLDRVDERLEVATHYRQLLRAPLFDGGGPSASYVEKEIRRFCKERLEILLSIKTAEPVVVYRSPFSEEENRALKLLAASILKKPELLKDEPAARPAPVVPTVRMAKPPEPPLAPPPRVQPAPPRVVPAAAPVQQASKPTKSKQGRPKKTVTAAPQPSVENLKKETFEGSDGEVYERELPRVQRPKGMAPWPTDMEGALARQSADVVAIATSNKNRDGLIAKIL